ncbi:hypothetical protein [Maribellus mangrovi]|uniref:hypothetical protein n=1 Tax=Maribellus mangrovi TaxID=3133146 RepID=UPI0030ED073C
MKKIRILLMLFLIVLASGITKANEIFQVEVVPGQKNKTEVDVLTAPNVPVVVKLEDIYGNVVYSDKEKSSEYDFKKLYDFSQLADGTYTFVVEVGDENSLNNIEVENGKVKITGREEQLAPEFKLEGKFLEFTFPNIEDKRARLLLFDKDNANWVYQESLIPEYDIEQTLNLSELHTGEYMAVLISGKSFYNYDFELM